MAFSCQFGTWHRSWVRMHLRLPYPAQQNGMARVAERGLSKHDTKGSRISIGKEADGRGIDELVQRSVDRFGVWRRPAITIATARASGAKEFRICVKHSDSSRQRGR